MIGLIVVSMKVLVIVIIDFKRYPSTMRNAR